MTLTDVVSVLTICVTALALLATALLSVLALRIAGKFSGLDNKVANLEAQIKRERHDLIGLRVISSIILRFVNESYALTDITRRQIEDIVVATKSADLAVSDVANFSSAIEKNMMNFPRITLYAKLLSPVRSEFDDIVDDVTDRYPDLDTLTYLEALVRVVDDAERQIVLRHINKLRERLLPYDSTLWTG